MRLTLLSLLLLSLTTFASIQNIRLLSDNTPDWTDEKSAALSMTRGLGKDDEQKAIALWKWIATMRYQVPPANDSLSQATVPKNDPGYGVIYNPVKIANNYANSFCVTSNSFMAKLWRHLGYNSKEFDINAHTVADLYYNKGWHNFDAAFGFYYKDSRENRILSCEEIVARHADPQHMMSDVLGCNIISKTGYFNASIYQGSKVLSLLNGKTKEYDSIYAIRNQLQSELYCDTYLYRLHLKPFEQYTRRWSVIADSLPYYLPVNTANPISPNWSGKDFLNIVTNGVWTFKPVLTNPLFLQTLSLRKNIKQTANGLIPSSASEAGTFIYRVDGANIISHAVVSASYVRKSERDTLTIHFSADSSRWIPVYTANELGASAITLPIGTQKEAPENLARTRDHYFLKVTLKAAQKNEDCQLSGLSVTTYTIVNPRTLPKLTLGSNRIQCIKGTKKENMSITYHWTEASRSPSSEVITFKERSHVYIATKDTSEYFINTAGYRSPIMDSVTIAWSSENEKAPQGYSDRIDAGAAFEAPKYFYTFGKNIASNKPVTATPTLDDASALVNDDEGPIDRCVTFASPSVQPEITVDLGHDTTVAGVRLLQQLASGYEDYLDSALVFTSLDGKNWSRQGAFRYQQVWEPITNYLPSNFWDKPASMRKTHANLLNCKFSACFDRGGVQARFVRFKLFQSRGLCRVQEVEVYAEMTKRRVVNEIDHHFKLPDPSLKAAD